MTTVPIPPWNAQGFLPPFWVGDRQRYRDCDLRLLAEAIVLEKLLPEMTEADACTRESLRARLATIERQLASTRLSDSRLAGEPIRRPVISEATETLVGEFHGVLPTGREFEFRLAEHREVIHGYIDATVARPETLNEHLYCTVGIRVIVTRVDDGPRCYRLIEVCQWVSDVPDSTLLAVEV